MLRFPDFGNIVRGLVLALFAGLALYVVKGLLRRHRYAKGLPGPKFHFLNLLGNISQIPYNAKRRNGHSLHVAVLQTIERFVRLYPKEDLVAAWFGFLPVIYLKSPESIQAVMTDSSLIEKPNIGYKFAETVMGAGLLTSIASKWKPRRRMLNPSYKLSVLMDFLPTFNEHGTTLVRKLQKEPEGKTLELVQPISLCVLDIAGEAILGVKIGAQDNQNKEYVDGLRILFSISMERIVRIPQWLGIVFRNSKNGKLFAKNLSIVHGFTRSILDQKKKEYPTLSDDGKRRSLLDVMLDIFKKEKGISEEAIIEEVDTFLAAGNESTSASLLFTLHLLGLDQEVQRVAHQELDDIFGEDKNRSVGIEDLVKMSYIECILKESLRLFPTVPIFAREAMEDKVICGYKVPKGAKLVVINYILHRDPKLYPDPERFDPSRFFPENCVDRSQFAYIPFSAGARNCIGQKFAMIEMKVVLSHILRSFRVVCLDPRDKVFASPELTLRTEEPIRFQLFSRI